SKILDSTTMQEGDLVVALPSSGVHSNGFSLVRKVFNIERANLYLPIESLGGKALGETLLTPTKIYVKPMLELFKHVDVRSVSHITGGGFYENIPRSIPEGYCARIRKADVKVLPIFNLIQSNGGISEHDMFNTYNMGVGMTAVVPADQADEAVAILQDQGEDAYVIGEIVKTGNAEERIDLC
ncbi:MAG: phosphoribosylformylglycinamidine cyclo-ligase, partial [Clostridia bacterium]|nr:phosphoribosylformylglycinamidine cyclo-ligase [Clostridia bacterium]